jgi:hypothetical protein
MQIMFVLHRRHIDYRDIFTVFYVHKVRSSQETHLWASMVLQVQPYILFFNVIRGSLAKIPASCWERRQSRLMFGRSQTKITAVTSTNVTEVLRYFPYSIYEYGSTLRSITLWQLPFIFFPINHSLVNLSFGVIDLHIGSVAK